jgi:hypothetical protein
LDHEADLDKYHAPLSPRDFGCEPSAIDLPWMHQGAPLTVLV